MYGELLFLHSVHGAHNAVLLGGKLFVLQVVLFSRRRGHLQARTSINRKEVASQANESRDTGIVRMGLIIQCSGHVVENRDVQKVYSIDEYGVLVTRTNNLFTFLQKG